MEDYFENNKNQIEVVAKNVVDKLKATKIELILGNELYFSKNMAHLLKEKKASTIGNSRYVLFEFPINEKPLDIYEYIYLLQENNYIPVLAHPERYMFVQNDPGILYEFVDLGVLLQANYGSIIGIYGKKAKLIVEKMLKNNLVTFLGSDVHRKNSIYPLIPKAISKIKKIINKEKFEELVLKNPEKVLKDEKIEMTGFDKIKISFLDKMKLSH